MTYRQKGTSVTVPAPIAGLNLRDQITALTPSEARQLENWFPDAGKLTVRPGYAAHGSGVGTGAVQTLAALAPLTSSVKLIAAGSGSLWDVSVAGAAIKLGVSVVGDTLLRRLGGTDDILLRGGVDMIRLGHTGALGGALTGNRWQWARFNARIFLVNGTDDPVDYDGTSVIETAWTGVTPSSLVNVANVRNRLWFCENNQAYVWYGGIGSVTGALTKFQLEQIASGGFCMAIGSWSRDAGDGMDDLTVFVMSTGQIIVYEGDPASTFTLIGKYDTGAAPLGRQCLVKVGGELVIITRSGLLPVSAAIGGKALDLKSLDPWGKVAPLIAEYAVSYGGNAGWHAILHLGVLYVNVPKTPQTLSEQIVLNTLTGAWATYTGWNAEVLGSFNNNLYFGAGSGGVVRHVTGSNDNGTAIAQKVRAGFVVPDPKGGRAVVVTAIRPRISAQGSFSGSVGVDTDYVTSGFSSNQVILASAAGSTPWGSDWGSPWGSTPKPINKWISVSGDGRSFGLKMSTQSLADTAEWSASDVLMVGGSIK